MPVLPSAPQRATLARDEFRMLRWSHGAARALSAIVTLLVALSASAAEVVVGSVLTVRGEVFAESAGNTQPLAANDPVHRGDTIVSKAGKAKIALEEGTVVSVGENTRVQIVDFERSRVDPKTRLGLLSGALRLIVQKVSAGGRFEVETETAIAAVRGTDWVIETAPEQTSVALVDGAVAVSDRARAATVLLQAPGEGTDVRRGAPPTTPITWGAQRYANALARATFD
jgi:hypothetical protein